MSYTPSYLMLASLARGIMWRMCGHMAPNNGAIASSATATLTCCYTPCLDESLVRASALCRRYEFDDTRVTAVREEVAVKQQYGGRHAQRASGWGGWGAKPNAYMLVYVRRDLCAADEQPTGALLPAAVKSAFERTLRGGRGGRAARAAVAHDSSLLEEDDSAADLFG